jgi:hypothetical protein
MLATKSLLSSGGITQPLTHNPIKGTRVIFKVAQAETDLNALVISLENSNLFIKQIFDEEAIKWLINNVY